MTVIRTALSGELRQALEPITRLAQTHQVARLEAFGSAVTGHLRGDSDVDLLVTFQPLSVQEHGRHYFGLKHDLEDLLGRPVDLLEVEAVGNPYFLQSIELERVLLYAA